MSPIAVSVLDLLPVRSGQTSAQAMDAARSLARVADQSGVTRYWLAEHHNTLSVASTNPPVAIAALAAATERMRVGSGGVMLPNHAPLVVAEQFALLEAAFPGRIDLGIGRAPGTDPVTTWALRAGLSEQDQVQRFPEYVQQVMAFMSREGAAVQIGAHRHEVLATPRASGEPPVWLLGSSDYSARLAAQLGLPYVFAHHFSGQGTEQAFKLYRESFRGPGRPRTFVTVNVAVGHDQAEAERLALPHQHAMARLRAGLPLEAVMTVEEAEAAERPFDGQAWDALVAPWLIGEPHRVAEGIFELADRFAVDEVMVHPISGSYASDPLDQTPMREFAIRELASRLINVA